MEQCYIRDIRKPILFNTDMVQANLRGQKSTTRRCIKYKGLDGQVHPVPTEAQYTGIHVGRHVWETEHNTYSLKAPYQPGDILYVRETWDKRPVTPGGHTRMHEIYYYKADGDLRPDGWRGNWHPSIHMPKEAARIFLRIDAVRVERLQDIDALGAYDEGVVAEMPGVCDPHITFPTNFEKWEEEKKEDWIRSRARAAYIGKLEYADRLLKGFEKVWNSTIDKREKEEYAWDANPWVWVVCYERV